MDLGYIIQKRVRVNFLGQESDWATEEFQITRKKWITQFS